MIFRYSVCLLLQLCFLIVPSVAWGRDTLKWADNYVPSPAAIKQSNDFALGKEMNEPLKDGWQHEGFKIIIDDKGQFGADYSSSLVVDRTCDPVLNETIQQARLKYGKLPTKAKAEALTKFAHETFTACGLNDDKLSDWDDSFGNQHRGERILLGEYIVQKKGVCEQEAVLLKVLADELGLPAKLIFGFDGKIAHVWTTMIIDGQELVYDPTQEIIGIADNTVCNHKTIHQLYGKNFNQLDEVIKANNYLVNKQYPEAEKSLRHIAIIDAQALGIAHPVYALDLERLADLLVFLKKNNEAETCYRQALKVKIKAWDYNQEIADCLNHMGNFDRELGKNQAAEHQFKQAIKIYEKTLGKDDVSVADPLFNLACLYEEECKHAQAKLLFERALTIYEFHKGTNSQDALDTRKKLQELN